MRFYLSWMSTSFSRWRDLFVTLPVFDDIAQSEFVVYVVPEIALLQKSTMKIPNEDHIILGHLQNTFKCYENKSYCYCISKLMGFLLLVRDWT